MGSVFVSEWHVDGAWTEKEYYYKIDIIVYERHCTRMQSGFPQDFLAKCE